MKVVSEARKAELLWLFEAELGLPRVVLVCRDGKIVGDAVVVVSEADPNWWRSMAVREGGKITLRGGQRWR